jgi:hypothetical protein
MKKAKILCISILGLLFLIPFVNFSNAAPGDYVGVNVGDSYSWGVSVNANQFANMAADMGETIPLDELDAIATLGSLKVVARVDYIFPEDTMLLNSTLVTYVPMNVTITVSVPGLGSEELGTLETPVFSNETDYYAHMMYYYFDSGPSFMFVAQNLNWTKVVENVNEIYSIHPEYSFVTVSEVVNGIKLSIPEGLLNASQKAIEVEIRYTDNGVLSYAGFKYDGVVTISLTLGGDDEIPGYMLPIVVGAIAAVGIGLIYIIKKKNRM